MNDHGAGHDALREEIAEERHFATGLEARLAALEAMAHDHPDPVATIASLVHHQMDNTHHTHDATPPPVEPPVVAKPFPSDGRITESGVYSGAYSNTSIGNWSYAMHVSAPDVTMIDSKIESSGFGIGQWAPNLKVIGTRFSVKNAAVAMWNEQSDFLMDECAVVQRGKNAFFLAQDADGDDLTVKRIKNITIQNSTFENVAGGHEGIYVKAAQNVKILSNTFKRGLNQWFTSFPDCLDVQVLGNSFDLTSDETWLAVEVPRTFGIEVFDNDVFGGGVLFYVNSGSTGIEQGHNTLRDGAKLGNP